MAAVDAASAALGGQSMTAAARKAMFEAIGTAIVAHFIANGVAAIIVVGTSATGGPVTGTGTIT